MRKRLLLVFLVLVFLGCASYPNTTLTREHGGRYYCVGSLCFDTEEDDCKEDR